MFADEQRDALRPVPRRARCTACPTVVAASGMTVDGWIPVDPLTLETSFPGVYAVGDVTSVGTPKAGVFAEGQAAVVADAIIAQRPRRRRQRSTTAAASATSSSATTRWPRSTSPSSPGQAPVGELRRPVARRWPRTRPSSAPAASSAGSAAPGPEPRRSFSGASWGTAPHDRPRTVGGVRRGRRRAAARERRQAAAPDDGEAGDADGQRAGDLERGGERRRASGHEVDVPHRVAQRAPLGQPVGGEEAEGQREAGGGGGERAPAGAG